MAIIATDEDIQQYDKTPMYSYQLEGKNTISSKLLVLSKKAIKEGILSIEDEVMREKNLIIKKIFSMMIEGSELEYIFNILCLERNWLIKIHQHFDDAEPIYIENLEEEYNRVINTMLYIYTDKQIDSIKNMLEVDYCRLDKEYIAKGYILKKESISQEIMEMRKKPFPIIDTSLDNNTLENPEKLIAKLVDYATLARLDGCYALLEASNLETNYILRKLIQDVVLTQKMRRLDLIVKALFKKHKDTYQRDKDLLFDFERELWCIVIALKEMMSGSAPRVVEDLLFKIYSDKYLQSIFE